MVNQLKLGEIAVDVVLKDIKNVHLSVYPPTGRVRISAPHRMKLCTIRLFAISKLSWIKQQQTKLRKQERETPREYLDRESHYVWGKRCLLKLIEEPSAPRIELKHNQLILRINQGANRDRKEDVVAQWYREQIKAAVPSLIAKWEPTVGVNVQRVFVQKMKTKWGSCNPASRSVRLNTDLAKKPRECLEYIVVHEMVHILEPTHNAHFVALMDQLLPQWRVCRDELNRLPVCHEKWSY
jgi:predicted metal-dependent hydrolase